MKKYKKILLLILIILGIYKSYYYSIKKHDCTYKKNGYNIEEKFYKTNSHWYDFTIKKKKQSYIFTINKNLKKQKRIIKKIKTYKNKNITCIIPIYKKDIPLNLYCNLDNQQVSIDYLLKNRKEDFLKIQEKIKKYKIKYPYEEISKKNYKKIKVYNKNILENNVYFIWNYKGIYILKKDKNDYQKILDYDLYDNVMSCIVDKYYVLFENTSVNGIKNIYYYDFKKNKLKTYKPEIILSKDTYINGVIDNLIYVTDNKEKKQYIINIKKEKIEEISNSTNNYIIYKNEKKTTLNRSDFFQKQQIFKNTVNGHYTYFQKENKIYKKKNNKTSLLLELNDIKEWELVGDEIILLSDQTIYSYTEENGLRKILENNELKYNYKNIYKVGKI